MQQPEWNENLESLLPEIMQNWPIALQLEKLLNSDRSIHAFLFAGGSKESREELGMWFAGRILCTDELSLQKFAHGNHEDFIVVQKPEDRESILKDQILALSEKLEFKPFGSRYAVLIKDAHFMNQIAQNKLLKTLEEPVSPAVFILLAEGEDALLETVRSRCVCFHLQEKDPQLPEEICSCAKSFASLVQSGAPYYRKKMALAPVLEDKEHIRENSAAFLLSVETELEKRILDGHPELLPAAEHVRQAEMYIKQLHNAAYTLKQLCLRV